MQFHYIVQAIVTYFLLLSLKSIVQINALLLCCCIVRVFTWSMSLFKAYERPYFRRQLAANCL